MRKENRIISVVIPWSVIKEKIIDTVEGLPKDVEIIGIRHENYQMYDSVGLYSKEFEKIQDGINSPMKQMIIEIKNNKINRIRIEGKNGL